MHEGKQFFIDINRVGELGFIVFVEKKTLNLESENNIFLKVVVYTFLEKLQGFQL